jgi:flagellar biosynthesis/type III secretory pathway chaperone
MDATKRVDDLIMITGRLADVLEKENALLREKRHSELGVILDEKETLARVYESRIMGLAENEVALDDVDEELRTQLGDLGERVDGLMVENTRLLQGAILASRRVMELVQDAVQELQPDQVSYRANGIRGQQANKARGVALSVDQTL